MINKNAITITILFVLLLSSVPEALCKPQPPAGLAMLFYNLQSLEDSCRDGDWSYAWDNLARIEIDLRNVKTNIATTSNVHQTIDRTLPLIKTIKKALAIRDHEAVEKSYIKIQVKLLDLMEQFEYPSPPALIIAQKYSNKGKNFFRQANFAGVIEEMREIEELKKRVARAMAEKGRPEHETASYYRLVARVKKKAERGEGKDIPELLSQMTDIISPLLKDQNQRTLP